MCMIVTVPREEKNQLVKTFGPCMNNGEKNPYMHVAKLEQI